VTQRCSACLSKPVPTTLAKPSSDPSQAVQVAGMGQGLAAGRFRIDRGSVDGTIAVGARAIIADDPIVFMDDKNRGKSPFFLAGEWPASLSHRSRDGLPQENSVRSWTAVSNSGPGDRQGLALCL